MNKSLLFLPLLAFPFSANAALSATVLSNGWRFAKGEQPEQVVTADFDDTSWQEVSLPHDWAISGPFDPNGEGGTGKLPWRGVGYYRTTLRLDAPTVEGQRAYLDFDGVMAKAKVYVNGKLAGTWDYGYTSFRIDATDYVQYGTDNVITVVADTRQWNSRWYPGAGIYRKVALELDNPVHIAHWGTFVTNDGEELAGKAPKNVRVRTKVENHTNAKCDVAVETTLIAPDGTPAGNTTTHIQIAAHGDYEAMNWIPVEKPILWDVNNPALYTVKTTVSSSGNVLDTNTVRHGIRTFAFTADDGFHLNGRRVQIQGVNLHSDLGPLGMAFNRRAAQRQLEIMQDMGVNALRTSHNPPAPEVLDLCDEMGIIVWDECFDKWDTTAGRFDGKPDLYEFGHRQIRSMVQRDRNHPSIVVWSVGNEIFEGGEAGTTPDRVAFMASFVREFDITRPVSMACCVPTMAYGADFASLDMTGWNYARRYSLMRERFPEKPLLYSESASAVSTRGYYEPDLPSIRTDWNLETRQLSSYDMSSAAWSDIAEVEFDLMKKDSFMAGEFVWEGIDYIGEPTPFDSEARSSYFGIVDLCGMPKDRFYLYRSHWNKNVPTVHILPHWNWEGREGKNVPVFVYTNGQSAELFLNGKSLGKRVKGIIPVKAKNYAEALTISSSSNDAGCENENVTDDSFDSVWRADANDKTAQLTFDLGSIKPVRQLDLVFEREEKLYGYTVETSADGKTWTTVLTKPTSIYPLWCGLKEIYHNFDASARYVRIAFNSTIENAVPAIRSAKIFPEKVEPDYYDVTYSYRLRWNEVPYEKGELKAVAYDDAGNKIGEDTVRTAGPAAKLRLTPDRTTLNAKGDDVSFILVEAIDKDGNLCPLADDMVQFNVTGAGENAGMDNGNPMCFESMQGASHSLFYGKAMLVVRVKNAGKIEVTAKADKLETATSVLEAR